MSTTIGELFGVRAPGPGEYTRIPVVLINNSGERVAGVSYGDVVLEYVKDGDESFSTLSPTIDNWKEIGYGFYNIVLSGDIISDADILDTVGILTWYVKASNSRGDIFAVKVSDSDVSRYSDISDLITHGDAYWASSAGSGSRTIVFNLSNGSGLVAGGVKTQIEDISGGLVAGPAYADTLGVVTYFLDDGDYVFKSSSSSVWLGHYESISVSGSSSVDITLSAQILPVSDDPDKYLILINATDEFSNFVGADSWSITVSDVRPTGVDDVVQLTTEKPIVPDGSGQATFHINKGTKRFTLEVTPTMYDGTTGHTKSITVIVDSSKAIGDTIILSHLMRG